MKKITYSILFALLAFASACSDFTEIEPKGKNVLSRVEDLDMLLNYEYRQRGFAFRSVMLLANDICARFSSLSNKFRTAGDSHLQILAASLMGPEDVVLFISYSGATRDMLETLRTAKASGAKIILLTHYEDSPGAAMADVVLRCGAQESPLDSGSIPIKVAVLYVGEVLLLRYMLDDPEHTNEAQDRTSEAVAIKLI